MSNPFIVISGGLVANEPALPVFDLDILDDSFANRDTGFEVYDLRDRIVEFQNTLDPATQAADIAYLDRLSGECRAWLDQHPALDPDHEPTPEPAAG